MKQSICVVLPGSGTRLPSLLGVVETLSEQYEIAAIAGTSGGGIVALGWGLGLPPPLLRSLMLDVLTRKDLLDRGAPWERSALALYRGRKIYDIMRSTFGGARLGEASIPIRIAVGDLWERRARLVDWRRHGDILAADAARCTMAINGFFDPWRLRPNDARLFCDGGVGLNIAGAAWDDHSARTVVVRFSDQQRAHTLEDLMADAGTSDVIPVRPGDPLALAKATADLLLDASAASFPSRKVDTCELVIESDVDGMAFGLPATEVERRRLHGVLAAKRWLHGAVTT